MWAAASAPTGWLLCDGSAVSRTTYAGLFAILSTTYGVGDGSTTFNLPDLRGRFPVGKNAGTFSALGGTGGEETHTLTVPEMPAHTHPLIVTTLGKGGGTPDIGAISGADNTVTGMSFHVRGDQRARA
jgi:microcystin-dependent protein